MTEFFNNLNKLIYIPFLNLNVNLLQLIICSIVIGVVLILAIVAIIFASKKKRLRIQQFEELLANSREILTNGVKATGGVYGGYVVGGCPYMNKGAQSQMTEEELAKLLAMEQTTEPVAEATDETLVAEEAAPVMDKKATKADIKAKKKAAKEAIKANKKARKEAMRARKLEEKAPVVAMPTVVVDTEDGEEVESLELDNGIYVRYSYSFRARLIQAEPNMQGFYASLMDEVNSYDGVKASESWKQVRISFGRNRVGLIIFKGKTLCITLALEPKDYEDTNFIYEDMSHIKRFEQTPLMVRITSNRKLDSVKELLANTLSQYEIKKTDVVATDSFIPYESREQLLVRELIKMETNAQSMEDLIGYKFNFAELCALKEKTNNTDFDLSKYEIQAVEVDRKAMYEEAREASLSKKVTVWNTLADEVAASMDKLLVPYQTVVEKKNQLDELDANGKVKLADTETQERDLFNQYIEERNLALNDYISERRKSLNRLSGDELARTTAVVEEDILKQRELCNLDIAKAKARTEAKLSKVLVVVEGNIQEYTDEYEKAKNEFRSVSEEVAGDIAAYNEKAKFELNSTKETEERFVESEKSTYEGKESAARKTIIDDSAVEIKEKDVNIIIAKTEEFDGKVEYKLAKSRRKENKIPAKQEIEEIYTAQVDQIKENFEQQKQGFDKRISEATDAERLDVELAIKIELKDAEMAMNEALKEAKNQKQKALFDAKQAENNNVNEKRALLIEFEEAARKATKFNNSEIKRVTNETKEQISKLDRQNKEFDAYVSKKTAMFAKTDVLAEKISRETKAGEIELANAEKIKAAKAISKAAAKEAKAQIVANNKLKNNSTKAYLEVIMANEQAKLEAEKAMNVAGNKEVAQASIDSPQPEADEAKKPMTKEEKIAQKQAKIEAKVAAKQAKREAKEAKKQAKREKKNNDKVEIDETSINDVENVQSAESGKEANKRAKAEAKAEKEAAKFARNEQMLAEREAARKQQEEAAAQRQKEEEEARANADAEKEAARFAKKEEKAKKGKNKGKDDGDASLAAADILPEEKDKK